MTALLKLILIGIFFFTGTAKLNQIITVTEHGVELVARKWQINPSDRDGHGSAGRRGDAHRSSAANQRRFVYTLCR